MNKTRLKRTELKRGKPIARKTRLRPMSKDTIKDMDRRKAVRKQVEDRDGKACKRCGSIYEVNMHERIPRSQTSYPFVAKNCCMLCNICNGLVHDKAVPDWEKWLVVRNKFRISK